MPLHWHRIKLSFKIGHVLTSGSTTDSRPCRIFSSDRLIFATCANLRLAVLVSVHSFFFLINFCIFLFYLFFLQHDTYISYIKVPFTRLCTYIALHYLPTVSTQYTVRRIRYSLWAGSHLEPVRKLYRNNSAWSILSHFCWNLFCESVTIDICFSISKLYFSCCAYSLIDGDMFLNLQQ